MKLLHCCARSFFEMLRRLLLRETILAISRLTDARETRGDSNLVLATLLLDPGLEAHEGLAVELGDAVAAATLAAGPIRAHRHKYIAHLDHATAIGSLEELLPGLSRTDISGVIEKMESAYNLHNARIHRAHNSFEYYPTGSAKALVEVLENSDRWRLMGDLPR